MTTTATSPAQLAAVRTRGTDVHAGRLIGTGRPDAPSYTPPRYAPLCGAGGFPAWGTPCPERVTCRNCQRGHAHAVATIAGQVDAPRGCIVCGGVDVHAGTCAALARMVETLHPDAMTGGRCRYCHGSDVHTGSCVARGDATAALAQVEPERSPAWRLLRGRFTCTGCGAAYILGDGMRSTDGAEQLCRRCHLVTVDAYGAERPAGVYALQINGEPVAYVQHNPRPVDAAPAVVWGVIASASGSGVPDTFARRLRGAWINAAQRRVYGLDPIAHDGRSFDAELSRVRDRDERDADTRARLYLAAYAAVVYGDERATPVDRLAFAFAAPDDAAQVAAGTRPCVGTVVTVDGHPGRRWEIIERSAAEAGRFPDRVRVRQQGHTVNASVPLAAVRPVGWQAVTLREYDPNPADGCADYAAHDARTGAYVGEVWHNSRGEWRAYRDGYGATSGTDRGAVNGTHATRADALAALDWFDTIPAAQVEPGAVLVLADGSTVDVDAAQVDGDRVTLTLHAAGGRLDVAHPHPGEPMRATVHPRGYRGALDRVTTYAVELPASVPLALTPPCIDCPAGPGEPCSPGY